MKQQPKPGRTMLMSYTGGLASKELAKQLKIRRISRDPNISKVRTNDKDVVINWGYSVLPDHLIYTGKILNHPNCVELAIDKIRTLDRLNGNIPIPPFTSSRAVAQEWLDTGRCVVARTLTKASASRGIVLVVPDTEDTLPRARLYTQYIPKKFEYRVHAFLGGDVQVRQKKRSSEVPEDQVNWQIRSHANGFIHALEVDFIPTGIEDLARNTLSYLGLDFGAVDIIYNVKRNEMYVLEVNTAPGLEGSTFDFYVEQLRRSAEGWKQNLQQNRVWFEAPQPSEYISTTTY